MPTETKTAAPASRELTPFGQVVNGVVSSAAMLGVVFPTMTATAKAMASKQQTSAAKALQPFSVVSAMRAVSGAYNGYGTAISGTAPTTVVAFLADSFGRRFFGESHEVAVAAGAGALAGFVNNPFERVKTVQQVDESKPTAKQVWRAVSSQEGSVRAAIRGAPLTMVREAFFNGTVLVGAKVFSPLYFFVPNDTLKTGAAVTTAAAVAGVASTPVELLRVRVHKTGCSTLEAAAQVFKESGARGFFTGIGKRCFIFVVAVPTMFIAKAMAPKAFPDALFEEKK